ncbi:ATP-binding protein [Virgisporangium aurantiacum]|uniref:DNA helicase HerA, contains HAS-barrel and ATPase domains n=1 Tax=Virgisporangium aurantiacum TaxID=175570 RepID=A0A8J3ZCL1_9ACTN|nr:ATP-binding protein [Virgisporangium aurantiacum]GIJ61457.1 hypothetical protein Vau01_089730 [Virgisporangium aurantiacum]
MTLEPSSPPQAPAPYVSVGADRVWCWVAYRIGAAVDISLRSGYASLTAEQRLARAVGEQAEYVGHLLGLPESTVVALRFVHRQPGLLDAYLIVRVEAPSHPQALAGAQSAATTLATVPDHVRLTPLGDPAEVAAVLAPFTPVAGGLAQIHKRIRMARPSRPDARVASYIAVEPFGQRPARWDALLDALRTHPTSLALSVELMAGPVPPLVRRMLEVEATRYSRLAKPVDQASEVGGMMRLGADASAMTIEPFYLDALRRYDARAFRFAVTLAAPDPLPDALVALVGATVSPPAAATPNRDDPRTVPSGHLAARPASQSEHDTLAAAFTTLQPTTWGAQDLTVALRSDNQPSPRDALRMLRLLVDRDEAASLFRLPLALEGHVPGLAVVRPRDFTRVVAQPTGPSLLLGNQDGESPVSIAVADLPRHGFIVGTPGSGKTNTALHLCRQLRSHGVPFAVIEPVNAQLNDYRWLATLPEFEDLLVFTVGDDDVAPFRLNPFQVPFGATVTSHVSNLLACFEAAFGLWDPLPFLYRRALVDTYRRRGLHAGDRAGPADGDRWPVLAEFVTALTEVVENLGYAGEVHANIDAAARLRAEALIEGACGTTLNCQRSYDIGALMRRPIIFELAGVGDNAKEQSLITLLIITAMRGWYRQHRRSSDTPHVLLLEEAHRVFPRFVAGTGSGDSKEGNAQALAAERIAQGLAEDRKYSQSYFLIDQQVGKVADDAYKITNLKVMHRTSAEDDRRLLGQTMSLTADQEKTAAGLKPFEALVSHNTLEQAVHVTVPNVRAVDAAARGMADAPLAENHDLSVRFARWRSFEPSVDEALAPFPECGPCRHRCMFRRHAESVVSRATVDDLFEDNDDGEHDSDEWWGGFPPRLASVSGAAPPTVPGTDPAGWSVDYRACVFLHAQRRQYPPENWSSTGRASAVAWVAKVHRALSAGPDA